jgi:hypothetical protein
MPIVWLGSFAIAEARMLKVCLRFNYVVVFCLRLPVTSGITPSLTHLTTEPKLQIRIGADRFPWLWEKRTKDHRRIELGVQNNS